MSFFNKTIKRQIKIIKGLITGVIIYQIVVLFCYSSGGWFTYGIKVLYFTNLSTSQWRQFSSAIVFKVTH